jgi:hypothetical protein
MNDLPPLILGVCLALSGCASTTRFNDDDANALIAKIQAPQDAGSVVTWIQPKNHSVGCKIYSSQPRLNPGVVHEATWDGKCQSGYAFGTGQEVMTTTQGTGSAIASYSAGQIKPDYYYQTNREPALVAFGDPQTGSLALLMQDDASVAPPLSVFTINRETDGTHYSSLFDPSLGNTAFIKQFPSGYEMVYLFTAAPQNPVAFQILIRKDQTVVGSIVRQYKNGTMEILEVETRSKRSVRLPEPYVRFLSATLIQTQQKSAEAFQNAGLSVATTAAYKDAVCKHQTSGTTATANLLCEETRDLLSYAARLRAADTEREQRFTETLKKQKVAEPWLKALANFNSAAPHPRSSLDDAVEQYVVSVNRARTLARYMEESAGGVPADSVR